MERAEGRADEQGAGQAPAEGRCLMAVMDPSGDHRLTWDPLDPEDVSKARAEFDRLRKAGYLAFRLNLIDPNVRGPRVDAFSRWDGELILEFEQVPAGEPSELVMVPAFQGG